MFVLLLFYLRCAGEEMGLKGTVQGARGIGAQAGLACASLSLTAASAQAEAPSSRKTPHISPGRRRTSARLSSA